MEHVGGDDWVEAVEVLIFKVNDQADPMIRSIPKAAVRLSGARSPGTPAPSDSPGTASPGPRKNPNLNRLRIRETAKLDYFTITLPEASYSRRGFAAQVRACVTGVPPGGYDPEAVQIGWYPWRAITVDEAFLPSAEDPDDPPIKPMYPDGTSSRSATA